MQWVESAVKIVALALIAFLLSMLIILTPVPDSYVLSVAISVVLCPLALGVIGGRWLRLGAAGTLLGINFLPVLMALDARFHLGEAVNFWWLLASISCAGAGWRLGRRRRVKS